MKRLSLAIAFLVVIAVFSSCSATVSPSRGVMPSPIYSAVQTEAVSSITPSPTAQPATASPTLETDTPEPSPTSEETMPEPTTVIPKTNVYTSKGLGITFTVPKSWVGKYRVEEGAGRLSVYFNPKEQSKVRPGDGEFFTIINTDISACSLDDNFLSQWDFELNGSNYSWGSIYSGYCDTEPELYTYLVMQKDIPAVFISARSISGNALENIKVLWIKVVPTKVEYITTMGLGIKFTLPKSWLGKCYIQEFKDSVSFYFKARDPNPKYGDGLLFGIDRKTGVPGEFDDCDGVYEFDVGGVTYVSSGPNDVCYDGPEYKSFTAMYDGIDSLIKSVRALN